MSKTIKYYKINKLEEKDFKRVIGVKKETFEEMVKVVRCYYQEKKRKGGRKRALSIKDEILIMLEYYREYRTFKHLSIDYGISESTAHYIVTKIEKILIVNPKFHIESLKDIKPKENSTDIDIMVVDVTESQCERPKKNKNIIIQGKRKSIQ
jgi:hypothetical protein